jgi:polar amino acid transport system substrate-binding protein
MKTALRLGYLFATYFLLLGSASAIDCEHIIVTGHPAYPPLLWARGLSLDGAPVRIIEKLGNELGLRIDVVNVESWENALSSVRTGKADVIAGIYLNEERTGWLEFVDPPYLQDTVSAIVSKKRPIKYSSQADLVGYRGIANKAESFGDRFDGFMASQLSVERADGLASAFELLLAGQTDYLINGTYPALNTAIERGIRDQIMVLTPPLVETSVYIAFSKNSPCKDLASVFGKGIERMTKSGEIKTIVERTIDDWERLGQRARYRN